MKFNKFIKLKNTHMDSYNKLSFTNFEYNFINLIKLYLNHHNTSFPHDTIVCRIAGGWVRDKILNIPSNDIDIAIENKNVSGQLFLQQLIQFYKNDDYSNVSHFNKLHNTDFSFKNIFNTGIHVTKVNSEKSKHLETAMASVFNHSIDFVSLRKESYTSKNRIPTIEVGTPLEDCLRRDCTINSLFYNINTGYLEDMSEMGLMDLKNGVIRTPLDPMKTFTDDPLRIFRLLRFKNKLDFKYHDDLIQCFKENHEVLCEFIYKKVSRERVAIEVNKILATNNANICKNFLKDLEAFNFERFLYSNNQVSYEDELSKLKQDKKINQKKNLLVDKIILFKRTLEYFENDLKKQIHSFVSTIESCTLEDENLDMTIVCHSMLLYPLLNLHLQYSIKQNDMNAIKRDMEMVLLSNGITKAKVKQIIALQELLCHEEYLQQFDTRASMCMFIKENITDHQIYSTFMAVLRIFFPDKFETFTGELLKNNIIKDGADDLDTKWNRNNLKLKWNGNMITKHLNKKPGVWMSEVISLEWVYLFENNIDVQDREVGMDDFIQWINQRSTILQ